MGIMSEVCDDAPRRIDLSWSKLKNYEACRQRTKLLIEKKKSPITDGRNFLPGTLADRCMRRWLEEGKLDAGGMLTFLAEEWEKHTGKESEYQIRWRGDPRSDQRTVLTTVKASLERLEPVLMEKVVPYPYKPEHRFKSVLGVPGLDGKTVNITLLGAVDVGVMFGQNEDGSGQYGLYDLKITENESYIRSTLAQLTFYDLAFWGWTGVKPVEHEFWAPMLPNVRIPTIVTDVERKQMLSRIVNYCHNVWAGNWQLTSNVNECYNCPVKHACPRWITPITKDQQGRNRVSFDRAKFDVLQEKAVLEDE